MALLWGQDLGESLEAASMVSLNRTYLAACCACSKSKPCPCSDKRLFRAIAVETVVEKEIRIWRGLFAPFTLLRWKRALEQKRLGHFYGGKNNFIITVL
jgi:hypothetical protein